MAVLRFLSEDWSPWAALMRMRKRCPEALRFNTTGSSRKAKANFVMAAIILAIAAVTFALAMLRPR